MPPNLAGYTCKDPIPSCRMLDPLTPPCECNSSSHLIPTMPTTSQTTHPLDILAFPNCCLCEYLPLPSHLHNQRSMPSFQASHLTLSAMHSSKKTWKCCWNFLPYMAVWQHLIFDDGLMVAILVSLP
jgi:hypothetical protein